MLRLNSGVEWDLKLYSPALSHLEHVDFCHPNWF